MRRPLVLVLAYGLVAGAWVVVTTTLAASSDSSTGVELIKGLAFVVVTGALLFAVVSAHEQRTRSTAHNLRELIESAGDVTYRYRVGDEPGFEYISDGIAELMGVTPEEHYARPDVVSHLVHPDDRHRLVDLTDETAAGAPITLRWITPDGRVRHTRHDVRAVHDRRGRVVAFDGRIRDVTDERRDDAEQAVGEAILDWVTEGCRVGELAARTCDRLVALMEVEVAWVGVPVDDGTVRPVAGAGDPSYVARLGVRWDDGPLAQGPTGTAVREGRPVAMHTTDPGFDAWQEQAHEAGITASVAVPVVWQEATLGTLTVCSRFGDPFDEAQVRRLDRIGRRLGLAIGLVGGHLDDEATVGAATPRGDASADLDVERVLAEGRLEVWWQPQVAPDGHIVAAEALLRVRAGDGRVLPPAAVLPAAAEAGRSLELGRAVRRLAVARAAAWVREGLDRVCLNVSMAELGEPGFPAELEALISSHGVRPWQVELEMVESAPLDGRAARALTELHRLGVRIAVDDYGSGWASLGHLAQLPTTTLKIDKVFVRDLGRSERIDALISSTIELGRTLGLTVVAEGVEHAEQARRLRDLGCDLLQGFLLSPPLEADRFEELLAGPHPWGLELGATLTGAAPSDPG